MRIPGEGMRFDNKNKNKNKNKNSIDGDLLIEFNVEFPAKLVSSANMIEQLTSILPLCILPVNDTSFVRSKGGYNNGVLFGCPTSFSSTSCMLDNENVFNNDSSVVERVIIKEDAFDDVGDVSKKNSVISIKFLL